MSRDKTPLNLIIQHKKKLILILIALSSLMMIWLFFMVVTIISVVSNETSQKSEEGTPIPVTILGEYTSSSITISVESDSGEITIPEIKGKKSGSNTYEIKAASVPISQGGSSGSGLDITYDGAPSRGAQNAVAWALQIADDNSFTYGYGPTKGTKAYQAAHSYGCYFCGTNKYKVDLTGDTRYYKTYCCNPFIHAAYAHGAGNQKMLMRCQKRQGLGMSDETFQREGCWTYLGKPEYSELLPGDVLVKKYSGGGGHVWMYIGDDKIVQATGASWSENSISVSNTSKGAYERDCQFVERYVDQPTDQPGVYSASVGTNSNANATQSSFKTYDKHAVIKHIGINELSVYAEAGAGSQSMTYIKNGIIAVCQAGVGTKSSRSLSVIKKFNSSSTSPFAVSQKLSLGHGNGLTYNPTNNSLYSVQGVENSNFATLIDADSLKVKKTYKFPSSLGNAGAISYDPATGIFITASGDKIRICDADLKTVKQEITKKVEAIPQDQGARFGVIYNISTQDSHGNAINMYLESNGEYIGSYKVNIQGELESIDIDEDGYLYLLFYSGTVYKTKEKLAKIAQVGNTSINGGSVLYGDVDISLEFDANGSLTLSGTIAESPIYADGSYAADKLGGHGYWGVVHSLASIAGSTTSGAVNGTGALNSSPNFNNDVWTTNKNPYDASYRGQCTWFAWARFYEIYGFDPGFRGNGSQCVEEMFKQKKNCEKFTFQKGGVPKPGSVFSWNSKNNHVGIVISVSSDGKSIVTQEGNLKKNAWNYPFKATGESDRGWSTEVRTISYMNSVGSVYAIPKG